LAPLSEHGYSSQYLRVKLLNVILATPQPAANGRFRKPLPLAFQQVEPDNLDFVLNPELPPFLLAIPLFPSKSTVSKLNA
jgi:hypothetical protein